MKTGIERIKKKKGGEILSSVFILVTLYLILFYARVCSYLIFYVSYLITRIACRVLFVVSLVMSARQVRMSCLVCITRTAFNHSMALSCRNVT